MDVIQCRRTLLGEGVVSRQQTLVEHATHLFPIVRLGARHVENVFTVVDRVQGRTVLGVTTETAGSLGSSGFKAVRGLDLRKLDGVFPEAVKILLLTVKDFPLRVLGNGDTSCAVWGAVRQGIFAALQQSCDIVGDAMAVKH